MDRTVHRALWITYVCRQFRTTPEDLAIAPGLDIVGVLGVLGQALKSDDPLLGIGLWNLLSAYDDRAFPPPYTKLFRTVYSFEAAHARETSRGKEAPVFPLDAHHIVQEPTLKLEETLDASTVRLELCVNSELERLEDLVDPLSWSECDLFWKDPARSKDVVTARLQLPDAAASPAISVTLDTDVSRGGFEVRSDFNMKKNARIEMCRGFTSVQKEPGRPGLIRITQQRTVRFRPGFDRYRVPTILYWVQAEIACMVLKRLRQPAPPAAAQKSGKRRPPVQRWPRSTVKV